MARIVVLCAYLAVIGRCTATYPPPAVARSTKRPKPRVPTKAPSRMTGRPRTKTERTAPVSREALVRRVVAGVVQVGGAQGPSGGRVEEHEVGIAAGLDGALARQAEQPRRRGREQVDQALDRQATLRRRPRSRRSRAASRSRARRCRCGRTRRRARPRPSRPPCGRGRGRSRSRSSEPSARPAQSASWSRHRPQRRRDHALGHGVEIGRRRSARRSGRGSAGTSPRGARTPRGLRLANVRAAPRATRDGRRGPARRRRGRTP